MGVGKIFGVGGFVEGEKETEVKKDPKLVFVSKEVEKVEEKFVHSEWEDYCHQMTAELVVMLVVQ